MKIERISVDRINPAPYNPRKDLKPDDPEYQKLVRSLDTFGCVEPLVWNQRSGYLVGGHQRFKVMLARGDKEIYVSVVDLPPEQERALNIALNKISGEWDPDRLSELLSDLIDSPDIDVELTGFDLPEIEELICGLNNWQEDPEAADAGLGLTGPSITQPGDLIELGLHGEHRLFCADATKQSDAAKLLGDKRAALCHTDPPYGVRYDPRSRPMLPGTEGRGALPIQNDDLTPKQYAPWFSKIVDVIREALIPGAGFTSGTATASSV